MMHKKHILFYMMVFATTLFINNRNVYATANPVTLVAPVNGFSSTDGKWPALQWSAGAGMSTTNGYRIQVSKVANFATLVVDECTRETSYLPADAWWAQTQMGTFYWRINYVSQHWSTQAGCKRQSVNNGWWS